MIFNYGLVGKSLKHSLSQEIHKKLFKLKNLDYGYSLIETDDIYSTYDKTLHYLKGFNVTIPYKRNIIMFLDGRSEKVKLYDSCNTVYINDKGERYGENTDVFGFLETLRRNHIKLEFSRVLILGTGGVSRMMAFESVLGGADCYIYSRNYRACQDLKNDIKRLANKEITIIDYDSINNNFDCVFNGTPCGMFEDSFNSPIALKKICNVPFIFDAIYNPETTLITSVARYMGNTGETGFYMLVCQAAKAQEYFTNSIFSGQDIEKVMNELTHKLDHVILRKNIILIGPPGAGKSTISKELSKILNAKAYDIDDEIEKLEGDLISNIFKTKGEAYFRNLEKEMFLKLTKLDGVIISTGAGIVENTSLSEIDHNKNITVYLDVNRMILVDRLKDCSSRPLLIGNLEQKLNDLLARRQHLYTRYADVVVKISANQDIKKTTINLLDRILENEKL